MDIILLIAIVIIQIEVIWVVYQQRMFDKTITTQGKWILELCKKIEEFYYNEQKEEKDINKILSDMLNYPVSDNPYQE